MFAQRRNSDKLRSTSKAAQTERGRRSLRARCECQVGRAWGPPPNAVGGLFVPLTAELFSGCARAGQLSSSILILLLLDCPRGAVLIREVVVLARV